jgi:hypothetical protein
MAASAYAGPIATFGFTELNGDWDGVNQFFANDGAATSGDVSRILPVVQTALYEPGFAGPAGYQMTMTLSAITPAGAIGIGSFIVRDANGDSITADVSGAWVANGPFGFFNGLLTNVYFNETGDGIFQGPSGGSFPMDFSNVTHAEPYDGAIMTLTTGSWFTPGTPFSDESTLVHASILPEPTSIALAVLGLVGTTFRRRT